MLNRRSLLFSCGALALSPWLLGCNRQNPAALSIYLLEDSFPSQLLSEFQRQLKPSPGLDITPKRQLRDLYRLLQQWTQSANSPSIPDLVTLGDYWLSGAIQQRLIQPFEPQALPNWQQLAPQWQTLVERDRQGNLTAQGDIWGVPYRWGSLVIAYRLEEFQALGWTPTDWSDLWRSDLTGYVSLPDSTRSVIGLTLKKLGYSVNTPNLDLVRDLPTALTELHQQVKVYSSDAYLQPLLLGDTWIAVGWSTDVLPVLERDRRIAAIVPEAGTILTADLWVRPTGAGTEPATSSGDRSLIKKWIDFCWQPQTAIQLGLLGLSASPVVTTLDQDQLPPKIRQNSVLLPPDAILQNSEFLSPLSNTTVAQYRRLWTEVRQTV